MTPKGSPRRWDAPKAVTRRAISIGALTLALVSCGAAASKADDATTRACNLLAQAEDDMHMSVRTWVQDGKPSDGYQPVSDAIANYSVLISKAADEALSASGDISASFQYDAQSARYYKQAMDQHDTTSAAAIVFGIQGTVDKCRDAGVEMVIHDQDTGVVMTSTY